MTPEPPDGVVTFRERVANWFGLVMVLFFAMMCALGMAEEVQAQVVVERPTAQRLAPIVVQLDGIPTGSLVTMLMRDIMRVPYVIAPDVLADRRPMSVRLVIPRNQVPQQVVGFLRRNGLGVELAGGTVYVGRKGSRFAAGLDTSRQYASGDANTTSLQTNNVPSGSPLDPGPSLGIVPRPAAGTPTSSDPSMPSPEPVQDVSQTVLAYVPAHRDPSYLASVVGAIVPGLRFGARGESAPDTEAVLVRGRDGPDVLVMAGPEEDVAKARQLVVLLDRPRPLVAVKAVVMQLQNVHARGSALSILAGFAKGKLSIGSNAAEPPGSQFVRIASGAVSAVLSAVREDSRFKVVATPNLTALSGATATMNAGAQVPTLGNVTVAEGGTVQSVVYRDSGITLSVRPVVRGDLIEMDVREERSTFVRTTTGVEDSPTLQKSSVSASVILKSGESVALAGLTEASEGNRREGLLGGILGVRGRDKSDSELVVLLSAEVVPGPTVAPGVFFEIGDKPGAAS